MASFRIPAATRLQFMLVTAVWVSIFPNLGTLARFIDAPSAGQGFGAAAFILGGWLLVVFTLFTLLLIVGALFWGRSIKILCAILLIAAAIVGYFTWFYGTLFDKTMLINMLQTHTSETLELINLRLVGWILVVGVLPAVLLWFVPFRPIKSVWRFPLQAATAMGIMAVAVLALVFAQYSKFASAGRSRAITFHSVAPVNVVASAANYALSLHEANVVREPRGTDARSMHALEKPRLIVMVVGETARAMNHGLNGYSRDTTPRMREAGALYFPDTISCGTATAISLPCMFSGFAREEFTLAKGRANETLIDVISRSGTRVIWRDNDAGCKGVCDRVDFEDYTNLEVKPWCSEPQECLDEILLDQLEEKLVSEVRDTLLVLHVKGSHGPAYHKRYPSQFERFKPTCKTSDLSACKRDELVNAYDNTIVYTDHFLGETVNLLKKLSDRFTPAMLYVSDHGESLGENGLFLHGMPYAVAPKEQTRVPMLAWFSPQFVEREKWDAACMKAQTNIQRSHDDVYSTLLGMMDIVTREYNRGRDIFAECDPLRVAQR